MTIKNLGKILLIAISLDANGQKTGMQKICSTSGSGKENKESERNVDFYCIDSVERTLFKIFG